MVVGLFVGAQAVAFYKRHHSRLTAFLGGNYRSSAAVAVAEGCNKDLVVNAIKTVGDSLAANGRVAASHFCYLLAKCPFGDFKKKASKIVLIGSSHK